MKQCSKCGIPKDESEFQKRSENFPLFLFNLILRAMKDLGNAGL